MGEEMGEADLQEDRYRLSLHEAAHAVASHHFRPEAPIQYASVVKRDKGMEGFVVVVDEVERFQHKDRLIADVKCALASVWSEKHFFDDNLSIGPQSDLKKATQLVAAMVGRYAMGSTIMVWDVNEKVPERIEEEIQDTLQEYYNDLHDFMVPRRDQVELVAQLLAEHGTIDGIEIIELLERMEE
jgi:ATP-dependent Zn protease